MASVFALPILYQAVVDRFTADMFECVCTFGFNEAPKVITSTRRVTFTPGDTSRGLGSISAPKGIGRNPRSLATLEELFTLTMHGVDTSNPSNDLLQYEVARGLYDAVYAAMYRAAHGTFKIQRSEWLPKEIITHGACIRSVCSVDAAIFTQPAPQEVAPVDSQASTTLEDLDHEETFVSPYVEP